MYNPSSNKSLNIGITIFIVISETCTHTTSFYYVIKQINSHYQFYILRTPEAIQRSHLNRNLIFEGIKLSTIVNLKRFSKICLHVRNLRYGFIETVQNSFLI